eukprot:TRINITY_DN19587_c0_g1_i1.p1 TRINITY_DN19587_c0_g1~~TRINITY_DN19587_c0_g1_i1.p1  ORF type:complete len:120 (+),score=8.22 TRINITY_DN19587_c0_g1_i1:242-601(+)
MSFVPFSPVPFSSVPFLSVPFYSVPFLHVPFSTTFLRSGNMKHCSGHIMYRTLPELLVVCSSLLQYKSQVRSLSALGCASMCTFLGLELLCMSSGHVPLFVFPGRAGMPGHLISPNSPS